MPPTISIPKSPFSKRPLLSSICLFPRRPLHHSPHLPSLPLLSCPSSPRPHLPLPPLPSRRLLSSTGRLLSTTRLYAPVRTSDEFATLLLASTSAGVPLITLWTASWCASCAQVGPVVRRVLEEGNHEGAGEGIGAGGRGRGPVCYVEVELDAVGGVGELGERYVINSVPTLLAFSRGEAQMKTRLTAVRDMKDERFLREWIEVEAGRDGGGGAGGGWGLGGLWGWWKS